MSHLIDRVTLVALAEHATARLATKVSVPEFSDYRLGKTALRLAHSADVSALRFVAEVLRQDADPAAADAVLATADKDLDLELFYADPRGALENALRGLVILADEEGASAAASLVRSKSTYVRSAIAGALSPTSEVAKAALFMLAKDADGDVQREAKEALGGEGPPLWFGYFPSDPLTSLSAKEAARTGPLLRAAIEAEAALRWGDKGKTARLWRAVSKLPDDLAAPVLCHALRRFGFFDKRLVRRLATMPLAASQLAAIMVERADENDIFVAQQLSNALRGVGAEPRAALARALQRAMVEAGAESAEPSGWVILVNTDAKRLLGVLIRGTIPIREIVEWVTGPLDESASALEREPPLTELHPLAYVAREALLDPANDLDAPLEDIFLAALERSSNNLTGQLEPLREAIQARLIANPTTKVLQSARRMLRSDALPAQSFALRVLWSAAKRKSTEKARLLVKEAMESPRLRGAVFADSDLLKVVLPRVRTMLVKGELKTSELRPFVDLVSTIKLRPKEVDAIVRAIGAAPLDDRMQLLQSLADERFEPARRDLLNELLECWQRGPTEQNELRLVRMLGSAREETPEQLRLIEEFAKGSQFAASRRLAKLRLALRRR
ncbi:MAG: hypothetical protein U0271_37880 [Polyangiaceae bacterium]